MIGAMRRRDALVLSLVGLACPGGCGGSSGPATPAQVAVLPGPVEIVTVAGGDVFCGVLDGSSETGSIQRVVPDGGAVTPFAADQFTAEMAASPTHLVWRNFYASINIGDHLEVEAAPLAGGATPTTLVDRADAVATDGDFVYWTQAADGSDARADQIDRAPIGGGDATVVATGLDEIGGIAVDDTSVYFVARDLSHSNTNYNVYAVPTAGGGSPVLLAEDVTGLGGAGQVLVNDANVYFIGATGGGATYNFAASVPKTGGDKVGYAFGCTGVNGIAVKGGYLYASCDQDIQGFRTTDVHTIRRAPIGGGDAELIGQLPVSADADAAGFTGPALDDNQVYVGYGAQLLAI